MAELKNWDVVLEVCAGLQFKVQGETEEDARAAMFKRYYEGKADDVLYDRVNSIVVRREL